MGIRSSLGRSDERASFSVEEILEKLEEKTKHN